MLSLKSRIAIGVLTVAALAVIAPAQSQACGLFSWLCPSCWGQPATVGYAPYAAPACATPTYAPATTYYPPAYATTSYRPSFWSSLGSCNLFSCFRSEPQVAYYAPPTTAFYAAPVCAPTTCCPTITCDPCEMGGCATGCCPTSYSGVDSGCATGACGSSAGMAPALDATPMPLDNGTGGDAETPQPTFKDNGGQDALRPTPDSSTRSSIMTMPRLLQPERQTKAMPVHRTSYEQRADDGMVPLDVSGWRAAR